MQSFGTRPNGSCWCGDTMNTLPRTRFCTIAEIAEKTHFGTTTIHRALHRESSVSKQACRLIRAAILELNEEAIRRYHDELVLYPTQSRPDAGNRGDNPKIPTTSTRQEYR
jgi:hypothetical protein